MNIEISSLLKNYRTQEFTPIEVIEEVYRRIENENPHELWTYLVPKEEALAKARTLIESGETDLPLYGIPFSVKDNIHVKELQTTAGCKAYAHFPEKTATVVDRILEAGGILIGKNTMDQFATGLVGVRSNPHPRNSFNRDYIPGGSSSGSAVAVAKKQVSFSLASDTGGSGRVPAALNNIVGLKPTPGIISSHGMVYANRTFDCVPIFALTCTDAKTVFDCIAGPDEQDPFMRNDFSQLESAFNTTQFKVGIPHSCQMKFFGDHLAEAEFKKAIDHMIALGGEIEEIDFNPFIAAGKKLFNGPYLAERLASIEDFFKHNRDAMNPVVSEVIAKAQNFSALDFFKDFYELQNIRVQTDSILEKVNLIMVPTAGTIYTVEEINSDPFEKNANMGYYTYFSNLLQLSALALPFSIRQDDLPFGVCLLAQAMRDIDLIKLGCKWQSQLHIPLGAPNTE